MIWVTIAYMYILKIAANAHMWLYSYASLHANDCNEFITVLTSNQSPFKGSIYRSNIFDFHELKQIVETEYPPNPPKHAVLIRPAIY